MAACMKLVITHDAFAIPAVYKDTGHGTEDDTGGNIGHEPSTGSQSRSQ